MGSPKDRLTEDQVAGTLRNPMSGSTRETGIPNHCEASMAPKNERVGKPIGIAYNWEIWSLLYCANYEDKLMDSSLRLPKWFFGH